MLVLNVEVASGQDAEGVGTSVGMDGELEV